MLFTLYKLCSSFKVPLHERCISCISDNWKTCSNCDHVLANLDLSVREWRCPSCQSIKGRDENAAKNIQAVGTSTVGLDDARRAVPAIAV